MDLCHRGCGLVATYYNTKGNPCCDTRAQRCPVVKKKIGERSGATRRANPVRHSDEVKAKRSIAVKKAWDEGRKTVYEGQRERVANLYKMRGAAWNKGLDITDPRVAKYADAQRGVCRSDSKPIIAFNDPIYNDFKKYRNRVATRTQHNYRDNKEKINPNDLQLGKAGIDGAHHIDHIISVRYGFEHGIPVDLIAAPENLQVIPWIENMQKYSSITETKMSTAIREFLEQIG